MRVSFARKYQAGAAVAGAIGGADVTAAGASATGGTGTTVDPRVYQEYWSSNLGKYGGLAKFGLDALDVGTDFLAGKAWEKYANEKKNDLRAVKDAVNRSRALRQAALGQASLYDNGGAGALAAAGIAGLTGIGLYQANNPTYTGLAKQLGQSLGKFIGNQLPSLSKETANDIYTLQDQGVKSAGVPPTNVGTVQGSVAVTNSVNQSSANPYTGYVQAAKRGTKLIRRIK